MWFVKTIMAPKKKSAPLSYNHQALQDYLGTHDGPLTTQSFNNLYTIALPNQATPDDSVEQLRRHSRLLDMLDTPKYKDRIAGRIPVQRKEFLETAAHEFLAKLRGYPERASGSSLPPMHHGSDSGVQHEQINTEAGHSLAHPDAARPEHDMVDAIDPTFTSHDANSSLLGPAVYDAQAQAKAAQDFANLSHYQSQLAEESRLLQEREERLVSRETQAKEQLEATKHDWKTTWDQLHAYQRRLYDKEKILQAEQSSIQERKEVLQSYTQAEGKRLRETKEQLKQRESEFNRRMQAEEKERHLKEQNTNPTPHKQCVDENHVSQNDSKPTAAADSLADLKARILQLTTDRDHLRSINHYQTTDLIPRLKATIAENREKAVQSGLPPSFLPPHVQARRGFLAGPLAQRRDLVSFKNEVCALAETLKPGLIDEMVQAIQHKLGKGLLVPATNDLRELVGILWEVLEKVEPMAGDGSGDGEAHAGLGIAV